MKGHPLQFLHKQLKCYIQLSEIRIAQKLSHHHLLIHQKKKQSLTFRHALNQIVISSINNGMKPLVDTTNTS